MEKQYCKVGATTPITSGNRAISVLEYQYRVFSEKALQADHKLKEFFELKAIKIKRTLENLV